MNSLRRMSAYWECPECKEIVEEWTCEYLVNQGGPVCPDCGEDLVVCENSGHINLSDGIVHNGKEYDVC